MQLLNALRLKSPSDGLYWVSRHNKLRLILCMGDPVNPTALASIHKPLYRLLSIPSRLKASGLATTMGESEAESPGLNQDSVAYTMDYHAL